MNTQTLRAVIWEEWGRVRPWLLATFALLALYVYFLASIEPSMRKGAQPWVPTFPNGFITLEHTDHTPRELFLVPIILFGAMILGVLATYETARGLTLGMPGRYFVMPCRSPRLYLVQAAARFVLAAPLAWILAWLSHVVALNEDIPPVAWECGIVVGIAGTMAASVWWYKLGALAPFLWIVIPAALWVSGTFNYTLVGTTPFIVPSAEFALVGLFSGAWLLHRGGALESFTAPRQFDTPLFTRAAARAAFRGPAAALRWCERPRFAFYAVPVTAGLALIFTAYIMYTEIPMILRMHWLPWTPTWVKALALLQAALARWGAMSFEILTWILIGACGLEGLIFLRKNLLHRPFHLRLPVSSWDLAFQSAATVGIELLRTVVIGLFLFGGASEISKSPNIGSQYIWPNDNSNHTALLDMGYNLNHTQHGLAGEVVWNFTRYNYNGPDQWASNVASLGLEGAAAVLVHVTIAWTAFWQVMWFVVPLCWDTGLESVLLVGLLLFLALRWWQSHRPIAGVLALLAALTLTLNYALWLASEKNAYDAYLQASPVLYAVLTFASLLFFALFLYARNKKYNRLLQVALLAALSLVLILVSAFFGPLQSFLSNAKPPAALEAFYYGNYGPDAPARVAVGCVAVVILPIVALWGLTAIRRHE